MNNEHQGNVLLERLHVVMARNGLTIKEMAERCGIPKSSMESYMRVKGPKRPGVDALIAISKGMDVSIDWLVGRSDESFASNMRQRDYAVACFNVSLGLLRWLRDRQKSSEAPILQGDRIAGLDDYEIAARSMYEFSEAVRGYEAGTEQSAWIRGSVYEGLEEVRKQMETSN